MNIEQEKIAFQESILHLRNELSISHAKGPVFLGILCQSGFDFSNTEQIPEQDTLFSAFILKGTNYILLAHPSGTPQVLDFTTFTSITAA